MIKRTLYFGNDAYLHTKQKQLVVDFADKEKPTATVPIEDIGVVVLDGHSITISQTLISRLLHNNAAVVTCNEKHMPQGLLLNLDGNTIQQERFNAQIAASLPLKKQLWQQTTRAKIMNQRAVLLKLLPSSSFTDPMTPDFIDPMTPSHRINEARTKPLENMQYWAESVRSGDPDNYEARAAAFYWKMLFTDFLAEFKRGREEADPNNLLNYGYAILRAITARSLVASGLLPTLGIHHHNRYNAFALADDIMEPYRPYVDEVVWEIVNDYADELTETGEIPLDTHVKKQLLQIPALDVMIDDERSPLMLALQRTTTSLFQCYVGNSRKLLYPVV